MIKLTNVHYAFKKVFNVINKEKAHFEHLITTYPEDSRFEQAQSMFNILEKVQNFLSLSDDTAILPKDYEFMEKIYAECLETNLIRDSLYESPVIIQTIQSGIPEVEEVVQEVKPKKKVKTKV